LHHSPLRQKNCKHVSEIPYSHAWLKRKEVELSEGNMQNATQEAVFLVISSINDKFNLDLVVRLNVKQFDSLI